jgi:hypothetical protein
MINLTRMVNLEQRCSMLMPRPAMGRSDVCWHLEAFSSSWIAVGRDGHVYVSR